MNYYDMIEILWDLLEEAEWRYDYEGADALYSAIVRLGGWA